ncbi:hypothetical protein DFH09DRAFT_1156078 [Mycena vulgaris]|nr:hypothetical protein DFH09DRAFT_1156078 [Mycena vulgaris]
MSRPHDNNVNPGPPPSAPITMYNAGEFNTCSGTMTRHDSPTITRFFGVPAISPHETQEQANRRAQEHANRLTRNGNGTVNAGEINYASAMHRERSETLTEFIPGPPNGIGANGYSFPMYNTNAQYAEYYGGPGRGGNHGPNAWRNPGQTGPNTATGNQFNYQNGNALNPGNGFSSPQGYGHGQNRGYGQPNRPARNLSQDANNNAASHSNNRSTGKNRGSKRRGGGRVRGTRQPARVSMGEGRSNEFDAPQGITQSKTY